MLFSTPAEINAHISNSGYENIALISGALSNSEETFLYPYLGDELYKAVTEGYAGITNKSELTPLFAQRTPMGKLIYLCQRAIVYDFMYRTAHINTVRLTVAAGLNRAGTDNFEPADNKVIDAYKESCMREAHKAIDSLLLFLEIDASTPATEGGQQFTAAWKKSRWYSLTAGRIINTAAEFTQMVDIYDSREKFVKLMPDVAYVEEVLIRPTFGSDFINKLMEEAHRPLVTTEEANTNTTGTTEPTGGTTEPTPATPEQIALQQLCLDVLQKIQRALAVHVEARSKMFSRPEAKNDATLLLDTAVRFVIDNSTQLFPLATETCPLRAAMQTRIEQLTDNDPSTPAQTSGLSENSTINLFDNRKKGNAIFGFPTR